MNTPEIDPIMIPLEYAEKSFEFGQKDIMDKLMIIAKPWIKGQITNEVFAQKLNEFYQEYGNTTRTNR